MIHLEENCYVLHQGYFNDVLKSKDEMILWPEKALTQYQLRCGRTYKKSIITESVQIISCYDYRKVWIWRKNEEGVGEWINPERQTYATSYEILESDLMFFNHSIPMNICSKEIAINLQEKLIELYNK